MRALARILAHGGRLYFSVPIGRERLEFNAQRIFAPATVLQTFADLDLVSFAVIDDSGRFEENVTPADYSGARSACGLFEFSKP
jgi:hypothetical protein